jgi:signal transduction histidine kinase
MPPDVKERICEPFFSTKLDHGGTGLGLAISNFIIKEHKGSLEFESEPGKGTTAMVKLPVWNQ